MWPCNQINSISWEAAFTWYSLVDIIEDSYCRIATCWWLTKKSLYQEQLRISNYFQELGYFLFQIMTCSNRWEFVLWFSWWMYYELGVIITHQSVLHHQLPKSLCGQAVFVFTMCSIQIWYSALSVRHGWTGLCNCKWISKNKSGMT